MESGNRFIRITDKQDAICDDGPEGNLKEHRITAYKL
jgi:hypothetical protein